MPPNQIGLSRILLITNWSHRPQNIPAFGRLSLAIQQFGTGGYKERENNDYATGPTDKHP